MPQGVVFTAQQKMSQNTLGPPGFPVDLPLLPCGRKPPAWAAGQGVERAARPFCQTRGPGSRPSLGKGASERDRERPRTSAGRCRPKRGARERCPRRRVSVGFADRAQTALLGGGTPGVRGHEDNSVRGRRVEQNLRLRVGDRNARC